jgi:hypothetical protein
MALVLMTLLAMQPLSGSGASYHSGTNPVGEKVYASQLPRLLVPVAIVIIGFSVAALLARLRRPPKRGEAGEGSAGHSRA